jgi:hypothetical protein
MRASEKAKVVKTHEKKRNGQRKVIFEGTFGHKCKIDE